MQTLLDQDVNVAYSQIYVASGPGRTVEGNLAESFAGQRNGLAGAALANFLWLVTGLHTGAVRFTVELHDRAPTVDDTWEDVVEVSFQNASSAALCEWGGTAYPLALDPGTYRVRYCVFGMDAGKAADVRMAHEPEIDRYLLQFWRAPAAGDQVLRQTSDTATYWHAFARRTPPPSYFEARRRAAERAARRRRDIEQEAGKRRLEELYWGGPKPEGPLGEIPAARTLVRFDLPLARLLVAAPADRQGDVARWAARRTYEVAGLADVDWIRPALRALDERRALPPPFDDATAVWNALWTDDRVPHTLVRSPDGTATNWSQQAAAVPALFAALHPDPAVAVFDVLHHATVAFGYDHRADLYAEIRRTFFPEQP